MKVNALGYRLNPVGKADLSNLAQRLVHRSGEEFMFRQSERRLYCSVTTSHGEVFLVGIFLTIRDHKKFLQLTENNGTLCVTVTQLDDASRPFDFNFFVLHLSSGSGLYSQYHFSCSFPLFHAFLRDQYLRANKECENGKKVDDECKVCASKKRNLHFSMFHRRDSFEDVVKSLAQVRQFEYDILTPSSMTQELQPMGDKLTLERRHLRFGAELSGSNFWQAIKDLLPRSPSGNQRFRVIGEDESGDRVPIDLIAPPDHFAQDEYDDLADDETLTLSDVQGSVYVGKLLQLFEDRKTFFTAQTGN